MMEQNDEIFDSSRFDLFASIAAALVAALVGGLIWADVSFLYSWKDEGKERGQLVATVESLRNVVRKKPGTIPVWNMAKAQESLYSNDYVFTDRHSSVQLKFVDQGSIELGQNTLIQVARQAGDNTLNLLKGTLRAEGRGDSKPLAIKVGKKGALLKADAQSRLSIKADESGRAEVTVLSGNAKLEQAGQQVTIGPSQTAVSEQDGTLMAPRALEISLKTPLHDSVLTANAGQNLTFTWESKNGEGDVVFELANDPLFESLLTRQSMRADRIEVAVPSPGAYYWRVRSQDEAGEERRLVVRSGEPPDLLWPMDNAVLEMTEAQPSAVLLQWQGDSGANYLIELAISSDFANPLAQKSSTTTSFASPPLSEGDYYWRVKEQNHEQWSQVGRFQIKPQVPPSPPAVTAPENEAKFTASPGVTSISFQWETVVNGAGYQLEIAEDREFKKLVEQKWLQGTELKRADWVPKATGQFYWRMRAMDEKGRASSYSPVRALLLEEPASAPLPPPSLEEQYEIEVPRSDEGAFFWEKFLGMGVAYAADDFPTIKWPAVTSASAYAIQIARDEKFQYVMREQNVKEPFFAFEGFQPGVYYLRIATVNKDNVKGGFSKPVRVVISLPAPRMVKPLDDAKIVAGPEMELDWRKVDGTKGYLVEIARDSEFRQMVRSEKPPLSSHKIPSLEPGTYYWRVTALFKNGEVGKPSRVVRFNVEAPVEPTVKEAPVAAQPPAPVPPPPSLATEVVAAPAPQEVHPKHTWSLIAGPAPAWMKYAMDNQNPDLNLDATIYNSFFVKGRATLHPRFELQFFGRRLATELFGEESERRGGQKAYTIKPTSFQFNSLLSIVPADSIRDAWFGLKAGWQSRTLLLFERMTPRTVSVKHLPLAGPSFGLTGELPFASRFVLGSSADYVSMRGGHNELKSGAVGSFEVYLAQDVANSPLVVQYGYRIDRGLYKVKYEQGDVTIKDEVASLQLGIGWRH